LANGGLDGRQDGAEDDQSDADVLAGSGHVDVITEDKIDVVL